MTNKIITLLTTIILGLSACSDNSSSFDKKQLIGTWSLDSTSRPNGKYYETDHCVTLTFENNTDYIYDNYCGDAIENFAGKYFILDNPKRGLKTITLIPDKWFDSYDTIREAYMNFDIVSIGTNRLQLIAQTKYIKRDSMPYIRFCENYIYKRKK
jgi:hypothetical protein